jgi:hypothetical protein
MDQDHNHELNQTMDKEYLSPYKLVTTGKVKGVITNGG